MIGLIGWILAGGILYWICRYRVHVYVVTAPRGPRPTPAMEQRQAPDARRTLLVDALVSLGATRRAARLAADRAMAQNPQGSEDALLRAAIRVTQEAA